MTEEQLTDYHCPCCGGEMVEETRRAKSITYRCSGCGVSDVKLIPEM